MPDPSVPGNSSLLMNLLPFDDDVRNFQFAAFEDSSHKPSDAQQQAVLKWCSLFLDNSRRRDAYCF
jgi:hypothetical protein